MNINFVFSIALFLSMSSLLASDFVPHQDINFLIASKRPSPYVEKMLHAKTLVDFTSEVSVIEFITECEDLVDAHCCHITNRPISKPGYAFNSDESFFAAIMGGHWSDDKWQGNHDFRETWFHYYALSGEFFYAQHEFALAEISFVKAAAASRRDTPQVITNLFVLAMEKQKFFASTNKANKPAIEAALQKTSVDVGKIAKLYEKVMSSANQSLTSLDYARLTRMHAIAGNFDDAFNHGMNFLKQDILDENNAKTALGEDYRETALRALIAACCQTNRLAEAKNLLYSLDHENDPKHYSQWVIVHSLDGNWQDALANLRKASKQFFLAYDHKGTMVFPLIAMLSTIPAHEFDRSIVHLLERALERFPKLKASITALIKDHQTKTRHEKMVLAVKLDLVDKNFVTAVNACGDFDRAFQKTWAKSSRISNHFDGDDDSLSALYEQAQTIVSSFSAIKNLALGEHPEDQVMDLSEQTKMFGDAVAFFVSDAKKMQEHYKQEWQREVLSKHVSTFDDDASINAATPSNLKKYYQIEKASIEDTAKNTSAINARAKQCLPTSAPCIKRENFLTAFKDKQIARLWKTGQLPMAALEILDCLQDVRSMFDLRIKLSRPGAKLEMLKGNRAGQISLRINDNYRVCFNWSTTKGASDIEIIDYHR